MAGLSLLPLAALEIANLVLQHGDHRRLTAAIDSVLEAHAPDVALKFDSARLRLGWLEAAVELDNPHFARGFNVVNAPQAVLWLRSDGLTAELPRADMTFIRAKDGGSAPIAPPGNQWKLLAKDAVIRWHDAEGVSLTLHRVNVKMQYQHGELAAEMENRTQMNFVHARAQLNFDSNQTPRGTLHIEVGGQQLSLSQTADNWFWQSAAATVRAEVDGEDINFSAAGDVAKPRSDSAAADSMQWHARGQWKVGGGATLTATMSASHLQLSAIAEAPPLAAGLSGKWIFNRNGQWQLQNGDVLAASDDGDFHAQLAMQGRGAKAETMEANARLARMPAAAIWRYIPPENEETREARQWFAESLTAGDVNSARFHFAFNHQQPPRVSLQAAFENARIDIGDGWPAAEELAGTLTMQDDNIAIVGRGRMDGARSDDVRVDMPALSAERATLYLQTNIRRMPLADYLAAARTMPPLQKSAAELAKVNITAAAQLSLTMAMPLASPEKAAFAARLQLRNGVFVDDSGLPPLQDLTGAADIGNDGGRATLTGKMKGLPIALEASLEEAVLSGRIAADSILAAAGIPNFPASGETDFRLRIVGGQTMFFSDLRGVRVNLPPPLRKPPVVAATLQTTADSSGARATLNLNGHRIAVAADVGGGVDVAINDAPRPPPSSGVVMHGVVGGDINSDSLAEDEMRIAGEIFYGEGEVSVNLQHFHAATLGGGTLGGGWNNLSAAIAVDDFALGGARLGSLTLSGRPEDGGWRLSLMRLSSESGELTAKGRYQNSRTEMSLRLDAPSVPGLMRRLNLNEALAEGQLTITGLAGWAGSPSDFSLKSLDGRMSVRAGGLRYLERSGNEIINLLAVFSPESLLSLGFTELGQGGTYIDLMTGEISLVGGRIIFREMAMSNEDLKISLGGETDWETKTLDLSGRVRPGSRLLKASSAAALGAGVAAVNPLALAAGWFLGKVFEKPISEIGAYNYRIGGTWQNPAYSETGVTFNPSPAENNLPSAE